MATAVFFITLLLLSTCSSAAIEDNAKKIRQARSPYPRSVYLPALPGQSPDCAKNGETFCENISDYPGELIYKLLKNPKVNYKKFLVSETDDDVPPQIKLASIQDGLPNFEDPRRRHSDLLSYSLDQFEGMENFILEDIDDFRKMMNSENPSEIYGPPHLRARRQAFFESDNNDISEDDDLESLCPVVTAFVMPKVAMNVEKEWRYIVNMPEFDDMTQMVRMQNCLSSVKNKACSNACENRGYVSKCTTDFLNKNLLSLDSYGEQILLDTFMIPVGCSCQEEIV